MNIVNEVNDSLVRYFNTLTHSGYKSYKDVNRLLVFTFIEELLYGPLSQFIDDEDYNIINSAVECLYGDCMIPYPTYKESYDTIVKPLLDKYRITEDNINRLSEDSLLRVKS